MGRHSASHHGWRRSDGDRRSTGAVADAEQRALIEPDREAEDKLPPDEQDARESVHTDRDPADDIHLAAQRPQSGSGG